MPGRHTWHPSMFPKPASNMHAKPFKTITPPTGDTFIMADVSVRRRFNSPKQRRRRRENKRYVGSTLPQRHFKKWGRGESACWSERGLKIAWDKTETARLLMCAHKKLCKNADDNKKKQTRINKDTCMNTYTTCACLPKQNSIKVSGLLDSFSWWRLIVTDYVTTGSGESLSVCSIKAFRSIYWAWFG